jgi:hypothetical protein
LNQEENKELQRLANSLPEKPDRRASQDAAKRLRMVLKRRDSMSDAEALQAHRDISITRLLEDVLHELRRR